MNINGLNYWLILYVSSTNMQYNSPKLSSLGNDHQWESTSHNNLFDFTKWTCVNLSIIYNDWPPVILLLLSKATHRLTQHRPVFIKNTHSVATNRRDKLYSTEFHRTVILFKNNVYLLWCWHWVPLQMLYTCMHTASLKMSLHYVYLINLINQELS